MSVYLYPGGFRLVHKSGVGQALLHQRKALTAAGIPVAQTLREGEIVHINTVFPDSLLTALAARLSGKKVVYYAHSTMEDFRRSFPGSNWFAPLFKIWIKLCYQMGDVIITPTDYSRNLLLEYGIRKPIYSLSNGVDTDFFAPDETRRQTFRERYGLSDQDQVVISVGHMIERKGLVDYIALARQMPHATFFWFGHTPAYLIPRAVRRAMADAPRNLFFAGYIGQEELRDAYCGADVFAFLSLEETEGIVVLEALACDIPIVLRDIPVYQGWLLEGNGIWKAYDVAGFQQAVREALSLPPHAAGQINRSIALSRRLEDVGQELAKIYQKAFPVFQSENDCKSEEVIS